MKVLSRFIPLCIGLVVLLASCGYHNPYVYTGPEKIIYITDWKNRTSELGLDSKIYQSLIRWYQKSGSITISKNREGADLVLAGEIVSIHLPSRSYGANSITTEVKIRLKVRYILKDIASGKILMEVPAEVWTEDYLIAASTAATNNNEQDALDEIINDLSQKIYQKTLVELPKI